MTIGNTIEFTPMNPEIKSRWLTALRSGLFQQGVNRLHFVSPEGHKFCCLGVLCELALAADVVTSERTEFSWYRYVNNVDAPGIQDSTTVLPSAVLLWSGLSQHTPLTDERTRDGLYRRDLSGLNDALVSFADIADIIERTY